MINYVMGKFGWNQHLINPDTGKPRVVLVFCWSSNRLNDWADAMQPSDGILFRNFGENRSATEVVTDFERLAQALVIAPPPTPVILTTHRIELVSNEVARPDCIFMRQKGEVVAQPIWTLTHKEIRREHNLQKMWRGGVFD